VVLLDVTRGEKMMKDHREGTETYLTIGVQVERGEEIEEIVMASALALDEIGKRAHLLHLRRRNLRQT
jgi:hypothetical protein